MGLVSKMGREKIGNIWELHNSEYLMNELDDYD